MASRRRFLPFLSLLLGVAAPAVAGLGDCGQPFSSGGRPQAGDALVILKSAVGQATACDARPCICDVNGNGAVQASDSLLALRIAVGQDLALACACPVTTTTLTDVTTTTIDDIVTTTTVPNTNVAPQFPGLVLVVATDVDSVHLRWLPASDDATPVEAVRYDIHLSDAETFEPTPASLVASVVGDLLVDVDGLEPGTDYSVLVVAVDDDGVASGERDIRTFTTLPSPVAIDPLTPLQLAEDLGLGVPKVIDDDSLLFETGATLPAVGALLIGGDGQGGGYLRSVDAVEETPDGILVQTSMASLGDSVETISLGAEVTLFDVVEATEAVQAGKNAVAGVSRSGLRSQDSSGVQASIIRDGRRLGWADGDFVAEDLSVPRPLSASGAGVAATVDARSASVQGPGFEAGVEVIFEPKLRSEAAWTVSSGIQSGRVVASGRLTVRASAAFQFAAATAAFELGPVEIFRRRFRLRYVVAGVPVYQEVVLTLKALATGKASAAATASAAAEASGQATFGVVYDPMTQSWVPERSVGFSTSFEPGLDVVGGVETEIRVVPEIEVRFYETASASLSIEPFLAGEIEMDASAPPPCPSLQLGRFEFGLGAECFTQVDLTVLRRTYSVIGRTRVCGPFSWPLFRLPELELSAWEEDGSVELRADPWGGVGTFFEPLSAEWSMTPDDTGELFPDLADPLLAFLFCGEAPSHTVAFRGTDSVLGSLAGDLAQRCSAIEVACVATTTTTSTTTTTPPTTTTTLWSGNSCSDGSTVLAAGRQWEIKCGADGMPDYGDPHDADNHYNQWSGTCSGKPSKSCQPTPEASAACFAGVVGNAEGCPMCGPGEGICGTYFGNPTVWEWLLHLNEQAFAGHSDWRIPTLAELGSIVEPPCPRVPSAVCIAPSFGPTAFSDYWTRETVADLTETAWMVHFGNGGDYKGGKYVGFFVRAVRTP